MEHSRSATEEMSGEGSPHEARLTALLHELVENNGRMEAAQMLGVNYKTLARSIESEKLSVRLREALMARLLVDEDSAGNQAEEGAAPDPVRDPDDLPEGVGAAIKALREEQAEVQRQVERRLAALESGRAGPEAVSQGNAEAPSQEPPDGEPEAKPRKAPWREYPELVTQEPEPGEELVYGEAAPVIIEWRRAWRELVEARDCLSRAVADERLLALELVLIEEHELTLPPADFPWDWADRRREVWSRNQALSDVRAERTWAQLRLWLRRALTLGLWRK